jgi:hypothetical protein
MADFQTTDDAQWDPFPRPDLGIAPSNSLGETTGLPFAYLDAGHSPGAEGLHSGFGVMQGRTQDETGRTSFIDVLSSTFDVGTWTDPASAEQKSGIEWDAGVLDFQSEPGDTGHMVDIDFIQGNAHATASDSEWSIGESGDLFKGTFGNEGATSGWSGGFGVGNAEAGASWDENTIGIGAQANASQIFGEYHQHDPSRQDDFSLGGGFSVGGGGAFRLHGGDEDGDGTMEAGFGFDAGVVSLDFTNEVLGGWIQDKASAADDAVTGVMEYLCDPLGNNFGM